MDDREEEWVDVGFWKKWGGALLLAGLLGAALGLPIGMQQEHQRSRAIVAQVLQQYDVTDRASLHHPKLPRQPLVIPKRTPWLGVGVAGLLATVVGACVLRTAGKRELEYAMRSPERDRRAFIATLPDYRYATVGQRLAAVCIDSFALSLALAVCAFLKEATSRPVGLLGLLLSVSVSFVYVIFLIGTRGQTVGKWLLRVKVLALTEDRLSFRQVFLRYSIPMVISLANFGILATAKFGTFDTRLWLRIALSCVAAQLVWLLADGITLLVTPKRRAIHDFIGQSVVVRCAD